MILIDMTTYFIFKNLNIYNYNYNLISLLKKIVQFDQKTLIILK